MEKEKASERRSWPVRVFKLGEEPGDDLSGSTSAEQRLAMVWESTLDAWAVAGLPIPTYCHHETPISMRALNATDDHASAQTENPADLEALGDHPR